MEKKDTIKWNDKVQDRLTAIRAAKENDTAREAELIRQRGELEGRLRELGALSTSGLKKKMVDAGIPEKKVEILLNRNDLVVTYFGLKFVRAHFKMLCDKMDATIDDANQGKLAFAEDESDDSDLHIGEPTESELFSKQPAKEEDDDDDDQQRLPIGEVKGKEANGEERAKADGYVGDGPENSDVKADISELELPDRITRHLYKADLGTIGKLIEFGEQYGNQYIEVEGIGQSSSDEISHTLKKWRRRQNAAKKDRAPAEASA